MVIQELVKGGESPYHRRLHVIAIPRSRSGSEAGLAMPIGIHAGGALQSALTSVVGIRTLAAGAIIDEREAEVWTEVKLLAIASR